MAENQIKFQSILPIWMLLYFSHFILLFLTLTLLIDTILIYLLLKYFQIKMKSEVFIRTIVMAWILGFSAEIISLIFLQLMGIFFKEVDCYNIYSNGISVSTHLATVVISIVLTFFLTRFLFLKVAISRSNAFIMAIILSILSAPWLFIVPTNTLY
ncbi:MAG: hypothetical protein CVV02_01135 [Firmicutes bacterium HGW-Firmicutes-7]|nr:MAG: hypothetical protein CVV02_01135 [Firmicutes bacterium HGW-Firmicutes-7]